MAEHLAEYLSVFLMGLLGIWKAIPLGFAFGLNPVLIYLATTLGALVSALVIYFFGDWVRKILKQKAKNKPGKKSGKAENLFQKYGAPGLGFLGTLLIGPNATLLLGLLIVKSAKHLLIWTLIGITVWSAVLTATAASGIELFKFLWN